MNHLRVLSLTTLLLMLASRLPGQPEVDDYDSQVSACNDGTISFSVARAYREANAFSADTWEIQGWYNVDPGKCEEIGPSKHYKNGGMFGKDAVTLLAFAFRDSTGTWGSIKLQGGDDRLWQPSNQRFCVQLEAFGYRRNSSGGDLPRACDGAQTGYQMIPASFEYAGPLGSWKVGFPTNHELRVTLGPSDRAIPLGGAAQRSGGSGASQSGGDARTPPPQPTNAPRPVVSPAPAATPQRPRLAPIMIGKVDVSHLAGLERGDTPEYVSSIFGPPTSHPEQDSSAFGGYPHTRSDGLSIRVSYDLANVLSHMKIYSRGTRSRAEPLLNLFAKSESDAIALLGSPKKREYAETIDDIYLIWSFAVDGRSADQRPLPQSEQTLTLHFTTGVGCNSITLIW